MALNCGIIGLSSTGKTTIFNCISNTKAEIGFASKSNIGMCEVVDERLKLIDNISHSKRIVPATVEIVDLPGLSKGGQGVGNKLLAEVQTMDALIHVLRCFDDPNIPHSEGSIDPVRDMELVDLELQVRDLDLVTRKLERVQKLLKNGEKDNKKAFGELRQCPRRQCGRGRQEICSGHPTFDGQTHHLCLQCGRRFGHHRQQVLRCRESRLEGRSGDAHHCW